MLLRVQQCTEPLCRSHRLKRAESVFFNGEIADDTCKIRLVGFDPSQQRKLWDSTKRNYQLSYRTVRLRSRTKVMCTI